MGNEATETFDARMVSRMLFFSDAVFAIVLTLLVLELRPPVVEGDAALADALIGLTPKFVAFFSSFALISIFWSGHVAMTRRYSVFDWPTAWVNLLFLFTIGMMPFVSALIGEHGMFGLAWRAYCAVLVAASLAQTALFVTMTRNGGRAVGGITMRQKAWRGLRSLSPGIAFGVGLALSNAGYAGLSALCWLLIPVVLLVAQALFGERRTRTG